MAREEEQRSLSIRRTIRAPRSKVYEAWTKAEVLSKWFAPTDDYRTDIAELEVREGGTYRIVMRHPNGTFHRVAGHYQIVDPPSRLVFTWAWEGTDMEKKPTLVTLEFHEKGETTELVLNHDGFLIDEVKEEHGKGWKGCLDRLTLTLEP
jgi:uncharacterized protein YndB with AHSA1/START domain